LLRLPASWTWDFWLAQDQGTYHLFFLKASRALHDPDRRHWRATIGHAVSDDLRSWTEVADALVPSDSPATDDLATWTGSVVRDDTGRWWMFYTGVDRDGRGQIQRIRAATSTDLMTWHKHPGLVLESDPRWYEKLADDNWQDEAFRDPWVFRETPDGPWHMLITARARTGPQYDRGIVGHATSPDLERWALGSPLSRPDAGFGQLEVLQIEEVDGRRVLLFSCLHTEMSHERRTAGQLGGVWSVPIDEATGPFDITKARRLTTEAVYSGRLIRDPSGRSVILAFRHVDSSGSFVGEITDPVPVAWDADGTALRLIEAPADWVPEEHQVVTGATGYPTDSATGS
jgi:sucrose-6-phosphate hydrolase SacC (GH32 family)